MLIDVDESAHAHAHVIKAVELTSCRVSIA
jgi:hypothetical protein